MTRFTFIALPALIALVACVDDAPSNTVATSEHALQAECWVSPAVSFREYFDECFSSGRWTLCNGAQGADAYTRNFEPQDPNAACNNYCAGVHDACPAFGAKGKITARRGYQTGGNYKRERGHEMTCTCQSSVPASNRVFNVDGGIYYQDTTGHFCHFPDPSYVVGLVPGMSIESLSELPGAPAVYDGACHPTNRAFVTAGAIYYENAARHFCHFSTMESYQRYLNAGGAPAIALDQLPPGAAFDGACP